MRLPRRHFLQVAAGAAALPALARLARAQAYPGRPIRLLVGYAAGGPADITARLIAQSLSERIGQRVVVENRPGAGSNIAAEVVVRAPADGYTLFLVTVSNAINATLYDKLNFNFIRDMAAVAGVVRAPGVMEVNPTFPAKSVAEFIAYAKSNPGKINMASAGLGSSPHLYGQMFKMMAGVDLVQVDYRGSGPAPIDLLGGRGHLMFDPPVCALEHHKGGKLRPAA